MPGDIQIWDECKLNKNNPVTENETPAEDNVFVCYFIGCCDTGDGASFTIGEDANIKRC
jgi:hypothetical protein